MTTASAPSVRFDATARAKLRRILGRHVVAARELVALLEDFLPEYEWAQPPASCTRGDLHSLLHRVRGLSGHLDRLHPDAREAILVTLAYPGYTPEMFIARFRQTLQDLETAIAEADQELLVPPPGNRGRHPELVRDWFARNVRIMLEEYGVDVKSRAGARALSECLRVMLRTLGQPVPTDIRPLLNEARRDRA